MAYAYFKQHKLPIKGYFSDKPIEVFNTLLESNMPLHYTSSVGRLFDAIAYMLNICTENISYEAQAAIELESLAKNCTYPECQPSYELELKLVGKHYQIDTIKMWTVLLKDIHNKAKREDIAYRFHLSLGKLLSESVLKLHKYHSFDTIVLSGGVFNNQLLLEIVHSLFNGISHIKLLTPSKMPFGDGGISLGQAAICIAREKKYGK